jgi:hypothetical protein
MHRKSFLAARKGKTTKTQEATRETYELKRKLSRLHLRRSPLLRKIEAVDKNSTLGRVLKMLAIFKTHPEALAPSKRLS